SFMVRAAARHPRIALTAAVDPLPAPREAFARTFGARVFADFAELCRDPELEAIYLATPHRLHADQVVMALEHGKHVLVEKPLALTLEDCNRVVEAADRSARHVVVGHTHAFDPNIRELARIIESGAVGRVGMILTFNYNDFLLRPHAVDEFDPRTGGGVL